MVPKLRLVYLRGRQLSPSPGRKSGKTPGESRSSDNFSCHKKGRFIPHDDDSPISGDWGIEAGQLFHNLEARLYRPVGLLTSPQVNPYGGQKASPACVLVPRDSRRVPIIPHCHCRRHKLHAPCEGGTKICQLEIMASIRALVSRKTC